MASLHIASRIAHSLSLQLFLDVTQILIYVGVVHIWPVFLSLYSCIRNSGRPHGSFTPAKQLRVVIVSFNRKKTWFLEGKHLVDRLLVNEIFSHELTAVFFRSLLRQFKYGVSHKNTQNLQIEIFYLWWLFLRVTVSSDLCVACRPLGPGGAG